MRDIARKPGAALFFATATAPVFFSGSPTPQIPMGMAEYLRSSGMVLAKRKKSCH